MLKTRRVDEYWLITQPDHAALSGQMAVHWGNAEFARPGDFSFSTNAEMLRREFELAVAEHDNGWWEWEAAPSISADDGLPQGLGEVIRDPAKGMDRWKAGVPRLADQHPYASLLISFHAYSLYAAQFIPDTPVEFRHQLQRAGTAYPPEIEDAGLAFLEELNAIQQQLRQRVGAVEQLEPHGRLLQLLDAISLALCSAVISPVEGPPKGFGEDHLRFENVPRASWDDRVPLDLLPLGEGRIQVTPYPFDVVPLPVSVPVRKVRANENWRGAPFSLLRYEFFAAA